MNERLQRLEALFEAGVAVPPPQRAQWLAGLEVADDLRDELARLLAADDQSPALTRRIDAAVAAAVQAPAPGMRLGPWRLLRELGSGGNGVVFLAERADEQFDQQVAVKVIRGVVTADAVLQLRHERQVLAGLEHPCIARLLDGGATADGHPWLVMEFVRGEPIAEACRRRGLPPRERLALVAQLARAVHHAHQRLIVHRDIKPGNVLLREDGRPVLLDFGIAKLLQPGARPTGATQPWFTPAYASPEQRRGEPVNTATDVYALGLLACELLTDAQPRIDAEGRVAAPSTMAPQAARRGLRGDLDRIVARACAPEPGRRYPSAEALAEDIDRYLADRPIVAAPDTLGYQLRKFLQRHPFAVAATLLGSGLLAMSAWQLADERDRALRAELRAQRQTAAAESVTQFLTDLFREAEPGAARARTLTPTALIDRGRERLAARPEMPAQERARLLGEMGRIYLYLGEPGKASETLREAVVAGRAGGAEPAIIAAYLRQLGSALDDRADYSEAEKAFAEAVAVSEAAGDREGAATGLSSLGLVRARQQQLSEALPLLREAVARCASVFGADSTQAANARIYLAEALVLAGDIGQAQPLMEQGIATLRLRLPPDDYELLSALSFQANLLREAGDAAGSERVLLEILDHRRKLLEEGSVLLADVYSALGSAYYEQGRTREASAQMAAALEVSRRSLGADDPSLAIDLNNLGSLYEEQGDYARAEPLLREGLAMMERHPEDHGAEIAQFRQNLGRLLMLAGNAAESRRYLEIPVAAGEGERWRLQQARRELHLAEWERRYGSAAESARHLAAAQARLADLGGAGSVRHAQLLRTGALLAAARGEHAAAQRDLEQALAAYVAARGERYVGCGDIELDLAELALARGDRAQARRHALAALRILDPVLVASAPQRARLAALLPSG